MTDLGRAIRDEKPGFLSVKFKEQRPKTMKRPSSPSSAPSKKQKKSPRVSETVIVVPAGEQGDQVALAPWEKVKNRKQKKAEKRGVKLDVCVF